MYIRQLTIDGLRSFEQAALDFQFPGRSDGSGVLPNINLLLGNNGAGKTTVLRAVALSILAPVIQSAGFRPYRLVRRVPDTPVETATVRAEVELHAQDSGSTAAAPDVDTLSTRIRTLKGEDIIDQATAPDGRWEDMFDDMSQAFLLVGYGASRRVEPSTRFDGNLRARSRLLRYERVAGLFEEGVTLTPLGAWLPQLRSGNPGRFKQVITLVNRLLPDDCRFAADTDETGEFLFDFRGVPVPFAALSDGFRAYIGWIGDLLYHVTTGAPSGARLDENRGIVLIDEIDLHLHPEWQRSVVPRIAEALPNLQFVLTTHSPIVAGTVSSPNIFVMESDPDGASHVAQYEERVAGKSAEQILLSSYFNLNTTRSVQMEDELATLSDKAQKGDGDAAIAYMKKLRDGLGVELEPPA